MNEWMDGWEKSWWSVLIPDVLVGQSIEVGAEAFAEDGQ
jgi:hypothetical protein